MTQPAILFSMQGGAAVARLAHNQEVAGSNPAPATNPVRKLVVKHRSIATLRAGVERVSRVGGGRSATATSELMDATAGETAPFSGGAGA
jgi:hypothetical protein